MVDKSKRCTHFEVFDSLDCELHLDFLCITGGVGIKRFRHCVEVGESESESWCFIGVFGRMMSKQSRYLFFESSVKVFTVREGPTENLSSSWARGGHVEGL